jgi:hypothetical protein
MAYCQHVFLRGPRRGQPCGASAASASAEPLCLCDAHARLVLRLDELPELVQQLVLRALVGCGRPGVPGAAAALRALARASRRWRALALAAPLWQALYELLGPHAEACERAMARHGLGPRRRVELLAGVGCERCGRAGVRPKVHWPFPFRACLGCVAAVTTDEHALRELHGVPQAALQGLPSRQSTVRMSPTYLNRDVREVLGRSPAEHGDALRARAVAAALRTAGPAAASAGVGAAELERRSPSLRALGSAKTPLWHHSRLAAAAVRELRAWAAAERAAAQLGLPGAAGRSPGDRVRAAIAARMYSFDTAQLLALAGLGERAGPRRPARLSDADAGALAAALVRAELQAAAGVAQAPVFDGGGDVWGACDAATLRLAAERPLDAAAAEAALAQVQAAAAVADALAGALRRAALPPELALALAVRGSSTVAASRAADALSWRGGSAPPALATLRAAWRDAGSAPADLDRLVHAAVARQLASATAWAATHVTIVEEVRRAAAAAPHDARFRAAILRAVRADAVARAATAAATAAATGDGPDVEAFRAGAEAAAARVRAPAEDA